MHECRVAMDGGSIRNAGAISNATHTDVGSTEFRREQTRATHTDVGSTQNCREQF